MTAPSLEEVYDPAVLMWTELCAECTALFFRWRDAPNPGAWANPRIQELPQLMAFLASCRVLGPSPQEWRETVSWQLLGIRRTCTERHADVRAAEGAARSTARAVEEVNLP
jgi:hypothetical protein